MRLKAALAMQSLAAQCLALGGSLAVHSQVTPAALGRLPGPSLVQFCEPVAAEEPESQEGALYEPQATLVAGLQRLLSWTQQGGVFEPVMGFGFVVDGGCHSSRGPPPF